MSYNKHMHDEQNRSPISGLTKKTRQVSLATLLFWVAVVGVVGFVAGTRSGGNLPFSDILGGVRTTNDKIDLSETQRVYQLLKANYDGQIDTNKLIDGANRGMVAATGDIHTNFFSKEETDEFEKSLQGKVSGVGAEIGVRSGQPTILRVLENSPAKQAGLLSGDVITKVNDTSTKDFDAAKTAELIRGDEGTTVKVVIRRGQDSKDFTITRAMVTDASVASSIQDGVGLLHIRRFDATTAVEARKAADSFVAANVRGVILDLRDNGGGQLDQVASVAGMWLDRKTVLIEKRGGVENERITSKGLPLLANKKTVVLVNGGTASASEIVAGALKDHNAATLVGEKTFGKGTVQQTIGLDGGKMLKVTIEHWYTPNGATIDKHGIEPNNKVELTIQDTDAGRDPQLEAAKKLFS